MSKPKKEIEKITQNPKHVRYEQLEKILMKLGCAKRNTGGSHVVYTYEEHRLTIPVEKPFLKCFYVKEALKMIDRIMESD